MEGRRWIDALYKSISVYRWIVNGQTTITYRHSIYRVSTPSTGSSRLVSSCNSIKMVVLWDFNGIDAVVIALNALNLCLTRQRRRETKNMETNRNSNRALYASASHSASSSSLHILCYHNLHVHIAHWPCFLSFIFFWRLRCPACYVSAEVSSLSLFLRTILLFVF